MNPASSDPTRPDGQPTAEAWALQAEWRGEPPSLAREEAGRALEALGRAAGEAAGSAGSEEPPPIPDDLRSRWAEAYGRPTAGESPARPVRSGASATPGKEGLSWLGWLLHPRRAAWMGGMGAVAAALLVWLAQPGGISGTDGGTNGLASGHRTRGSEGGVAPGDPAPIAFIVPAGLSADAVLAAVNQAYPVRVVHRVSSADEAAALARSASRLIVVNLKTGLVTVWSGGELADEVAPRETVDPVGLVKQIEAADDVLETRAGAP